MNILPLMFFGVMALLVCLTTDKRWPLAAWALVALIGVIDDTYPGFAPRHKPDVGDRIVDGFGTPAVLTAAKKASAQEPASNIRPIALKDGGY